jgi:hypothetical protein
MRHKVTERLQTVFDQISKMPEPSQDELAEWIESELSSDQRWATLYAKSQDQLADMAMEARADYDAGKTEDLNPDSL